MILRESFSNFSYDLPAIRGDVFGGVVSAVVGLPVAVLWPARFRKYLPSTLAALLVGTLLGVLWLTDAPVIGNVPTGLPEVQAPVFSVDFFLSAIQPALVIALVGSVDTLLTSLVADSMTRTRHNPAVSSSYHARL